MRPPSRFTFATSPKTF
jgi:hypothetical protein